MNTNAALIAGNPPQHRVQRLEEFWRRVTASVPSLAWAGPHGHYEFSRASMQDRWSAGHADMAHSLRELASAPPATEPGAFRVFDLAP